MQSIHQHIRDAYSHALAEVDPEQVTRQAIEPGTFRRVSILALGKAAPAMARGAASVLGSKLERTMVISDHEEVVPHGSRVLLGDHPYPAAASLAAGVAAAAFVQETPPSHELLFLISGGGSSLAELPTDGVTIEDLNEIGRLAMNAGIPIGELNTVRRHLSAIKNGGLAGLAPSHDQLTLAISDVAGERPTAIASGPTVSDESTAADALGILRAAGIADQAPPSVIQSLQSSRPHNRRGDNDVRVIADGQRAANAAAAHLERAGVPAHVAPQWLVGNAIEQAHSLCDALSSTVLVIAGETTMNVTGTGTGGRNQSAALAAALHLSGGSPAVFAALATDGVDGPTDATGAIVDEATAGRIAAAGLDPAAHLANDDAYPALDAGGALVRTGPTGTNVADLWFGWRSP